MQHHHQRAQHHHRQGMPQRVGNPEPHTLLPVPLNRCNVGDSCQVVVIKSVPQPKHSAGEEREFQLPVHAINTMRDRAFSRPLIANANCNEE